MVNPTLRKVKISVIREHTHSEVSVPVKMLILFPLSVNLYYLMRAKKHNGQNMIITARIKILFEIM